MSISKDFIKFRQHIRTLNLSVNEQYLLELFFEYNNNKFGYSFLEFSDIMSAFNTTSKNRISTTIKKLEKKKLIEVDRRYKNNRYTIIGIEKFINTSDKDNDKPNDSNGNPPLSGQVHFAELTEGENKLVDLGFTIKQSKKLLKAAKDKVENIIKAFDYAATKGATNLYAYTLWAIKNLKKISNNNSEIYEEKAKELKFNNFESRSYDYNLLEKKLLGWENNLVDAQEETSFDLKGKLALI
ncbi:helix-turn-helix domain-containing protein [Clostridium botulinum]|nr:helix-turn-helix domain-containing protein [Clostridium botulinum]NFP29005.1 helix-turn-helix domain-containing protein [Clostridium botulinum]